jgi:hypothetical protein
VVVFFWGWKLYQALPWFDPEDLLRGMEPIPIPIIDYNVGMMPFRYMSSSKVQKKAYVNMSLFSPFLRNYCDCGTRDYSTTYMPCECAKASGGEIAYDESGILKDRLRYL